MPYRGGPPGALIATSSLPSSISTSSSTPESIIENNTTTNNINVNEPTDHHHHGPTIRAAMLKLISLRSQCRDKQDWVGADEIHVQLKAPPYGVEMRDFPDKASSFRLIDSGAKVAKKMDNCDIWSVLNVGKTESDASSEIGVIPLILVTVDTPHYRSRLNDTKVHLLKQENKNSWAIESCDLLDLKKHPQLVARQVLFEGWRTVLLPMIVNLCEPGERFHDMPFLLIGEDDMRLGSSHDSISVIRECEKAFNANADVEVLSLGHAWTTMLKDSEVYNESKHDSLLSHLHKNKGAHGTTLIALRLPHGPKKLLAALKQVLSRKQTHLDYYLFHSNHGMSVAMCDPPVVGWSEVEVTLGPGGKRRGGGRHASLPSVVEGEGGKVKWVWRDGKIA